MSSTIIYTFDKNGVAHHFADVKNAWRGAMAVWMELEKRHLPPYRTGYSRMAAMFCDEKAVNEIWNLADREDIPLHERIVLYTTFDNCLVKVEDIPNVIAAFRKFGANTSLPEQADLLENLPNGTIAVGWNQTSVSGEDWSNFGGYDEENDVGIPYNCLTMDKHWWLFDELEERSDGDHS